ncbi:MAG: DUF5074 domain-containing protein [Flavobacteriales bacterium]
MKYKGLSTKIKDNIHLPRYMVLCTFFIILCTIFSSCKKDKPNENQVEHRFQSGKGVFVLNEGNFNWGNASVDYIQFESGEISRNIFESTNGFPLGDVLQSAYVDQERLHLVVNNSGRIRIVNLSDFKYKHSSAHLQSPRYMIAHGDRVFVSDLYANRLHVLRKSDLTLLQSISLSGWVEQMILSGEELVLANVRRHKLYFFNVNSLNIVDSLSVPDAPMFLQGDREGKLWVLSYGELFPETQGGLVQVDAASRSIIKSLTFPLGDHPTRLSMNSSKDTVYFINKNVYRMAIQDGALPTIPFINGVGRNFYALGIHPANGEVWVGDALDFVQPGRILRYTSSGNFKSEYVCGIIPGGFVFW